MNILNKNLFILVLPILSNSILGMNSTEISIEHAKKESGKKSLILQDQKISKKTEINTTLLLASFVKEAFDNYETFDEPKNKHCPPLARFTSSLFQTSLKQHIPPWRCHLIFTFDSDYHKDGDYDHHKKELVKLLKKQPTIDEKELTEILMVIKNKVEADRSYEYWLKLFLIPTCPAWFLPYLFCCKKNFGNSLSYFDQNQMGNDFCFEWLCSNE